MYWVRHPPCAQLDHLAGLLMQFLTFSPFLVSPSGASENDDIMPAAQLPIGCGQASLGW